MTSSILNFKSADSDYHEENCMPASHFFFRIQRSKRLFPPPFLFITSGDGKLGYVRNITTSSINSFGFSA